MKAKGGIEFIMKLFRENVEDLRWREDNGYLAPLMKNDIGKFHILKNCPAYLKLKGDFPSEASNLRHNNITLES